MSHNDNYYAPQGGAGAQQHNGNAVVPSNGGADAEPADRNVRKPWNEMRYADMDPKTKAEIRKQERDFKKDRDRTMGYFNSVSKAITDVTAALEDGSMDQQSVAGAFHAIADGFLTEFQKKLKTDVTIFRNSSACRVIEMVCTKSDLTQTKTFMYVLLGKVGDLMHSPTASFVFETILAALYRNLALTGGGAGGDDMMKEMENAEGNASGHGLPPTIDLLTQWVEEACECMDSLVMDVPGSRSLRTLLMMLSGRPIRGLTMPPNPPSFPDLLYTVADAATAAIEAVYTGTAELLKQQESGEGGGGDANPYQKKPAVKGNVPVSEAWYNACCANTTGAVVQALLQIDNEEHLANKLNRMYLRGSSVMQLLLDNIVGARVVQSLMRNASFARPNNNTNNNHADDDDANGEDAAAKKAAEEEAEAAAVSRWERVLEMVLKHPKLEEVIATPAAVMKAMSYDHPEAAGNNNNEEDEEEEGASKLTSSYEGGGGEEDRGDHINSEDPSAYVSAHKGQKRSREEDGNSSDARHNKNNATTNSGLNATVSPLFFLIQDLITFCPDAKHLEILWDELLSPRLNALVSKSDYGPLLTRFTRKCAYHGINALAEDYLSSATNTNTNNSTAGEGGHKSSRPTPSNHIQNGQLEEPNVRADINNGAPYFVVPLTFKESIVNEVCRAMKQRCTKGAAQALLVEKIMGDVHSAAIAYNMLQMGPKASSHFFNAVDKLKVDDLVASSLSAAGACVFQRFILTAAAKDALTGNSSKAVVSAPPPPPPSAATAAKGGAAKESATAAFSSSSAMQKKDAGALIRFIRRLSPHLPTLVSNKYAGYIVECAYEQTSVEGKEEIVKALTEFYQTIVNEDKAVRTEKHQGHVGFGAVFSLDPVSKSIAKKVMVKCCVEQYVHRKADWLKMAERQSNVKRMMMQILANDTL